MFKIMFGIPNYCYKVYLVRFLLSIFILVLIKFLMSWFAVFTIIRVSVFHMVYELKYSLILLAGLTFLLASLIKNARGAAVIMLIIGLIFLILAEPLESSKWNIFLNPFDIPSDMNYAIGQNVLYQNLMMLVMGSIISILCSLINLQKREKFV